MSNIEQFYDKEITKTTNFEVFQAIPHLIHMIGRDYKNDTKSVWIASGIFFNIILKFHHLSFEPVEQKIMGDALTYFSENCVEYCFKGLAEGVFFEIFDGIPEQVKVLTLFVNLVNDKKAESLAHYLKYSDMRITQLMLVQKILNGNLYDFGFEVFSQVGAELTHELLKASKSEEEIRKRRAALMVFCRFAESNKDLPKSHILIIKKAIQSSK